MQAIARQRSRSPAATCRYSKSKLPEVKTWVLVIADTNPKKRSWKNAVPGLISKVTQSHSISHSQLDTRVNVLIPNLLGLRYGFTGPRYAELRDLKLSDIRVYTGHDSTKLRDALVKAVQEAAKKRVSNNEEEILPRKSIEETTPQMSLPSCVHSGSCTSEKNAPDELNSKAHEQVETPILSKPRELSSEEADSMEALSNWREGEHIVELDIAANASAVSSPFASSQGLHSRNSVHRDTTRENIDMFFTASPSSPHTTCSEKKVQSSQPTERDTTQANIAALFNGGGVVISQQRAAESNIAPTTPLVSQRQLIRNDTPIEPESQAVSRGGIGHALDTLNLLEITAAVGKAFQDANEDVLSRQSLKIAVGKSASGISSQKFHEALVQLDAKNKIMLSDELVFLV